MTDIIENADPTKMKISKLLTESFVQMIVTNLKGLKLKKDDTLQAFYNDFFEALSKFSAKLEDDNEKVEIIQKLILYPGILCIEKYCSNRIVHQIISNLGENGIKKLFETYKEIFLNKLIKNPSNTEEKWLNVERQNAGYMLHTLLCHKNIQNSFEWRTEQLKFMMIFGLFYVNEKGEIVSQKNDCNITNEFVIQLKNIFYTSLQSKLPRLKDEKNILLSLVEVCNGVLQRKNYNKYLRNSIDEKIVKAWNEMYEEVHKTKRKKEQSQDTLLLVFHILLLHMGLQLFREPEMAEAAILDLEKCMTKAKEKKKVNHSKVEGDVEHEPEWIEVVIDLFLHLLSQNNSALRNVVNSVFPHLCNNLTLTAMHQILSVLNMKDGYNPLSEGDENEENEQDTNENEKINESSNDESDENDEDDEKDEKAENEDDDDDDDDEEIIEEEEEEEGTITDKLRNAVSVALGTIKKDADQESIDLDDMDEEEGKKLDEALTAAFKSIKRSDQNKRSKEYRIKLTTVMHFRIRVLDLIDISIQHNPSLLMCLEIMLALYEMIEFCGDNEQTPLSVKVEKVLSKLTALKSFSSIEDVTEQNICDFLRIIIEKKVRASVFEVFNKLRAKCCVFLISCGKVLGNIYSKKDEISTKILTVFGEYLNDFIKLRNPTINITLLCDIFKMRWPGIWHLAIILSQNGLSIDTTRVFRRIQILELLNLLYKNYELIREDLKIAEKNLKIIENCVQTHIVSLSKIDQISVREFNAILDFLFISHKSHVKTSLEIHFNKEIICNYIQAIRRKIKLENSHSYNRFCTIFELKIIKNSEVVKSSDIVIVENGLCEDDIREKNFENSIQKLNNDKKEKDQIKSLVDNQEQKIKRKHLSNDPRKVKKLRKEERLRKASEGLNGGMSFTTNSNEDEIIDDASSSNIENSD